MLLPAGTAATVFVSRFLRYSRRTCCSEGLRPCSEARSCWLRRWGYSAAQLQRAQPLRFHTTVAAAHAIGGHQQDELSIGAGLSAGADLAIVPQLAVGLKAGGIWLSEGEAPTDPSIEPEGDATVYGGAVGITSYPLASGEDGSSFSAAGLWRTWIWLP